MRGRLLRSTLTISLLAVITLGVPLLLLARHQVWSQARDALRQQAASVAAGLEDRLDAGQPLDLGRYAGALGGRRIVVAGPHGQQSTIGPTLTGPLLQATVTVADTAITVQAEQTRTVTRVRQATALVVALSLLAVVTAVGLALWQARRLTAPLRQLVHRADALGRGEFTPAPLTSGISEIDRISWVLERSSRQLRTTSELQRDFASDAAHQLRTPLTGIGLRLEELTGIGDAAVRLEAQEALEQVERLDRVISALLARARGDAEDPTRIDLTELLEHEAAPWIRALAEQGRTLALDLQPGLYLWARHDHLAGVVNAVLDNALQHGAGRVSLTSRAGQEIAIQITDQGAGVPAELASRVFDRRFSRSRGTGIGLALARSLAAAEGGRLDLIGGCGSTWQVTLPLTGAP